jgi:uncharacterized protein YbaP (TraB family)
LAEGRGQINRANQMPIVHRQSGRLRYSRTMRRFLHACAALFALVAALFQLPALAKDQGPGKVASQRTASSKPLRPALWRVSDRDTTIWLFGTVHVLPENKPWFTGKLAQAADGSAELVTELGTVDPTEISRVVTETAFLPAGPNLRELMTAEDRKQFEGALTAIKFPAEAFDRVKPWYAANSMLLLQLQQAGIAGANGPEGFLTQRFKAAAKPHQGLETITFQLGLFDRLPQEAQLRYLKEVVTGGADLVGLFNTIMADWGAGRSDALARTLNSSMDDPEIRDHMLIDRNKAWGQWVKTRLDQPGSVFVAVGAGHLAGPGSLQDQLKTLGIKVRRVQ